MNRALSIIAAALVLTACAGGGGGSGNSLVRPQPQQRIAFAPDASGHYRTDGLSAPAAADAKHMPVWRDNSRLGVGVDQGNQHLRRLPVAGARGEFQVRHGRLVDGVGATRLQSFMADTSAGNTRHMDPVPPLTVS